MLDIPSFKIGRVFGIPVEVNLSWVIIFGLLTMSLGANFGALEGAKTASSQLVYLVAGATALLFFASVLAHEVSHSIVTRLEGGTVSKITLFIFGGVAQIDEEPKSPGREFLMAAAGPTMSFLIAGVTYLLRKSIGGSGDAWWIAGPLGYLMSINLLLGVFNLLPGFPLDGGRVFRSIIWGVTGDLLKATKWAARSGQLIGWGMVVIAMIAALGGSPDLIWFGLVGWFIAWLAGATYRQQIVASRLAEFTAGDIMSPSPQYIDGQMSVQRLADDYLLAGKHRHYPVMDSGSIVGVVSAADLERLPREKWSVTNVLQVAETDLAHLTVAHDVTADKALLRLSTNRSGALIVVESGRMVGIITRADLVARIHDDLRTS